MKSSEDFFMNPIILVVVTHAPEKGEIFHHALKEGKIFHHFALEKGKIFRHFATEKGDIFHHFASEIREYSITHHFGTAETIF